MVSVRASLYLLDQHASLDFNLKGTRVISNQMGYPGESGCGFDPDLVIEI